MKKNMGIVDRIIRIIFAVLILELFRTGRIYGPLAISLGILAFYFVATGFLSYCPLYGLLRMSTSGKRGYEERK